MWKRPAKCARRATPRNLLPAADAHAGQERWENPPLHGDTGGALSLTAPGQLQDMAKLSTAATSVSAKPLEEGQEEASPRFLRS